MDLEGADVLAEQPAFLAPLVEIEVVNSLPAVIGHGASITQCVVNLLSNAVKFVPAQRKQRIRILAGSETTTVRLIVEDNGVGIAPGDRRASLDCSSGCHPPSCMKALGAVWPSFAKRSSGRAARSA